MLLLRYQSLVSVIQENTFTIKVPTHI